MSKDTGYKILGSAILDCGFESMASIYTSDFYYDIADVCANTEWVLYNAPIQSMENFVKVTESQGDFEESHISVVTDVKVPWVKTLPMLFQNSATADAPILRGTYPTFQNKLCALSSGTVYYCSRTDDLFEVKTESGISVCQMSPSDFREGIIPYNFLVEIQSGGSGGAGTTYGKWSVASLDGTGGGGGGYGVIVISFACPTWRFKMYASNGTAGGVAGIPSEAASQTAHASYVYALDNDKSTGIYFNCSGGIYAEIPAYDDSNRSTRANAGGIGGTCSIVKSTASSGAKKVDINGNSPIYQVITISGGNGGDVENKYVGDSINATTVKCVGLSEYANEYNIKAITRKSGGAASTWGSANPVDGKDWTGSGGGGASASGNGGRSKGNNGEAGAGGGGAYYSSYMTGGRGGDGYINIYY